MHKCRHQTNPANGGVTDRNVKGDSRGRDLSTPKGLRYRFAIAMLKADSPMPLHILRDFLVPYS